MREKTRVIWISLLFVIVSTFFIICLNPTSDECDVIMNIAIGVLGSSLVTLFISISEYLTLKKEALKNLYLEFFKVINSLKRIKYVSLNDRAMESAIFDTCRKNVAVKMRDIEDLVDYYEMNHLLGEGIYETFKDKKAHVMYMVDNDCTAIIKSMKSYLKIENISYENVTLALSNIAFFTDPIFKLFHRVTPFRLWINQNLYYKTKNILDNIHRINVGFFIPYDENEAKNTYVVAQQIDELQKSIFSSSTDIMGDNKVEKVYNRAFEELYSSLEDLRVKIYGGKADKSSSLPVYNCMTGIVNGKEK